jgi:hypothetical protein
MPAMQNNATIQQHDNDVQLMLAQGFNVANITQTQHMDTNSNRRARLTQTPAAAAPRNNNINLQTSYYLLVLCYFLQFDRLVRTKFLRLVTILLLFCYFIIAFMLRLLSIISLVLYNYFYFMFYNYFYYYFLRFCSVYAPYTYPSFVWRERVQLSCLPSRVIETFIVQFKSIAKVHGYRLVQSMEDILNPAPEKLACSNRRIRIVRYIIRSLLPYVSLFSIYYLLFHNE